MYRIYPLFCVSKSVTFLNCVSYFLLRFKQFLIENDTGYIYCVFNYLRFKKNREKRSSRKIPDIRYKRQCFDVFLGCLWLRYIAYV